VLLIPFVDRARRIDLRQKPREARPAAGYADGK
jgi:hypothetical protein